MVIFFLVIIVAAAALAVFALMPSKEGSGNEKKQESESLNSHFIRSELTLKLEEQVNSLNVELEKFQAEHGQIKAELSLANELVSNLKDELIRIRKNDKTVEYGELEKLRNENIHLRDELRKKSQELEKSLSDNLNLSKEISKNQGAAVKLEVLEKQIADYSGKIEESLKESVPKQEYARINNKCAQLSAELEALKNKSIPREEYETLIRKVAEAESKISNFNNENQDLLNKIKILENEINEHNKEIIRQKDIISKQEKIGEQSALETKELEVFKAEKSDLENKVKMLEAQIAEYKSQRQDQGEQIEEAFKKKYDNLKSRYEELKKKLEKAEEVLRMVHGAGA